MATIKSYRTSDSSKKITTYLFNARHYSLAFDFGSNEIATSDIKNLDYIFITHEHLDHFMGLLNLDYAKLLLDSKCVIYASNVTKDLMIAIFENALRVDLDKKSTNTIRDLLHSIQGALFYEKYKLNNHSYFRLFPSGHTFGSSMVYLHDEETKILYTGDMDFSEDDSDRQYQLDLKENESIDYIIADGTYLNNEDFRDEEFSKIRENIINKGFSKFYCKPEKMVFFCKKLMLSPKLKDEYCIVFSNDLKWYLKVLREYCYEPFITNQIILDSSIYEVPDKKCLFVSSKKQDKQTNVTGLVGLHISFLDFAYFLYQFDTSKTKVLVGHYNYEDKNDILATFHANQFTCDFNVHILEKGEYTL